MIKKYMIVFLGLLSLVAAIEIRLEREETCFDYQVTQNALSKFFYFHYNNNIDSVSMILYKRNSREVLQHTGRGIDYRNNLQVNFSESGDYKLCFKKTSQNPADVAFDIVDEDQIATFVGKEELAKTSKRISESLMDIKRVGWTFKGVLEQHNKRKEKIRVQSNGYGYMLCAKIAVMVGIVALQIVVVKKIFI